jgi:hypothetical protein
MSQENVEVVRSPGQLPISDRQLRRRLLVRHCHARAAGSGRAASLPSGPRLRPLGCPRDPMPMPEDPAVPAERLVESRG